MSSVNVTNKNADTYARKFDGVLYSFPPGEAVTIPEDAAMFLFGYAMTDEDRQKIVVSNGWQKNGVPGDPFGPDAAMKRLQNFVFKKGPEPKAADKPEKKVLPEQLARVPAGINAVNPNAKDNGRTILPSSMMRLPGSSAPLAARLPPAA